MPYPAAYKLIDEDHAVRDQLLAATDRISELFNDLAATLDDGGAGYDRITCATAALDAHAPLVVDWVWEGDIAELPEGWRATGGLSNGGAHRIEPVSVTELESLREVINNLQGTGLPDSIRIQIDARPRSHDYPTGVATGLVYIRWHFDDTGVCALFPLAGEATSTISDLWEPIPVSQYWLAAENAWAVSDEELAEVLAA